MGTYLLIQGEYLLRILGAALCGGLIGYERESHMKVAGIRTHAIVALTSCLAMIISKYGFFDVLTSSNVSLDPSRIASGVVAAIGFLGAGIIFTRKANVVGVVTAAGIWATVGIGMAFGAGMYPLSILTTLFILLLEALFHSKLRWLHSSNFIRLTVQINADQDLSDLLSDIFPDRRVRISNVNIRRLGHEKLEVKMSVNLPKNYEMDDIVKLVESHSEIQSVDV